MRPDEELPPSIRFFHEIVESQNALHAYMRLASLKTPVWAGAKGFAIAYDYTVLCSRAMKQNYQQTGQINAVATLACQVGISMREAHVLTISGDQAKSIPPLDPSESVEFIRQTRLPFDPFFIDFSSEKGFPRFETPVSREGAADIMGVLLLTAGPEDEDHPTCLYATPVLGYDSRDMDASLHRAFIPGAVIVNLTGDPNETYWWLGSESKFGMEDDDDPSKGPNNAIAALASSPYLEANPLLAQAYVDIMQRAVGAAMAVLYLLDFQNVEMVEKPFEKRDRKRIEKRNWDVPLVVRVARPSRRVSSGQSEGMGTADFSHQFDVRGHEKHFTKGPMARCMVCEAKPGEIPCPRCHGTGLDPEKVKPCTRRDAETGELVHPHGCRKIWCPPFVKGPESAPYVPKVRKLTV